MGAGTGTRDSLNHLFLYHRGPQLIIKMKYETNGILCGILLGFGLTGMGYLAGEIAGVLCGLIVAIGILMLVWGKGE